MAVSGTAPFIHVEDSNGNPYVGAILKVYEAGTTTYRAIYSDDGLTTALSNPLSGSNASDAAGNFPRFYMADGVYKVRAETSTGALIWEYDNIDTGASHGAGGVLAVALGGTGATTAGAARTNLGAASSTDVTDLATEIAGFSTSLANFQSAPQGRLTLISFRPVINADTASSLVYYTPYNGASCPIWDGTSFAVEGFDELTLTLTASHLADTNYDCFIINDSGTIRIVTGPAWVTSTAGAGDRGAGAGTTQIGEFRGIKVNVNAMATARNGASTYVVPASFGTYVGSIRTDSAGQVTCHTSYGQSRKWNVWNAYHRVPIRLRCGDNTASWTYTTATIRAARNDSTNSVTIFTGLDEEFVAAAYQIQLGQASMATGESLYAKIAIGLNSTTVVSGTVSSSQASNSNAATATITFALGPARLIVGPFVGAHVLTALEVGNGTTYGPYAGTESNMLLTAEWMG